MLLIKQVLGVMLSCVSPENYETKLTMKLKDLNVPFGFQLNGFITTKPKRRLYFIIF